MKQPTEYECQGICPKCKEFVLTGKTGSDDYYHKYYSSPLDSSEEDVLWDLSKNDIVERPKFEKSVMKIVHKNCEQAIVLSIKNKSLNKADDTEHKSLWESFIQFLKSFWRIG